MTPKQILVAFIIPVFNAVNTIERCINSILEQEGLPSTIRFVVEVVDDGSTDDTSKIIRKIQNRNTNINYFYKENSGVSCTRNIGMKIMDEADYFVFVDADDYLEKDYLYCFSNYIIRGYDFIYSDWYHLYKEKNRIEKRREHIGDIDAQDLDKRTLLWNLCRFRSGGQPWARVFKAEIIRQNSIEFLPGLPSGEDYLFTLEFLKRSNKIAYVKKTTYIYDCTLEGASRRFRKDGCDILSVIEAHKREIFKGDNYYKSAIECQFMEELSYVVLNNFNNRMDKISKRKNIKKINDLMQKYSVSIEKAISSHLNIKHKFILVAFILLFGEK